MLRQLGKEIFAFYDFLFKALNEYSSCHSRNFTLKDRIDKTIHVLGNGPSLKKSLHIVRDTDEVVAVNLFPLTEVFLTIKPKYLCLADPAFFLIEGELGKNGKKMLSILQGVDWRLVVIIPSKYNRCLEDLTCNENIAFKYFNSIYFHSVINFIKYGFYRYNLAIPGGINVVCVAIYCALQMGYTKIFLHGVDSDTYKHICVNDKNEMVLHDKHFYGADCRNLSKERHYDPGELYKQLECEVKRFKTYVEIAGYAKYLGASVINVSPNSMVDAFPRFYS